MTITVQNILDLFPSVRFDGDANAVVRHVQIDSRRVQAGDVFVALVGEKQDGHAFLDQALKQGAVLCLVEKPTTLSKSLLCPNTTLALAKIATWYRAQIHSPIIAITGSNGKTTSKELLQHALSAVGKTQATVGNLNNHLGVPLTILGFDVTADFSIVEMGMSAPNEIADLCKIATPNMGLITSVGPAHIENFDGKIENIAQAKGELFAALTANDVAIVNNDEPLIVNLATKAKRITFGFAANSDIRIENVVLGTEGTSFDIVFQNQKYSSGLPLFGKHHLQNALGVFATACALNVDLKKVAASFRDFFVFEGRGRFLSFEKGVIMDDTYNANPASMLAAFETLTTKFPTHTKIAVLGDMFELGAKAPDWHFKVGEALQKSGIDSLYALGENAIHYVRGFGSNATKQQAQHFASHAELAEKLFTDSQLQNNIAVLFKGSRGMKMEVAMKHYLSLLD